MRTRTTTAVAAVGIVAVTLVGSDAMTYAGTGDSLILGKLNKASRTTHVTSTGKGPALSLHAKGKRAALAVDSNAKIVRLHADRLDGWNAKGLQNNVRVYTATDGEARDGSMEFKLPGLPSGRYLASYSVHMAGTAQSSVASPTMARCMFYRLGAGFRAAADSTTVSVGIYDASLSATDVITKDSRSWRLWCIAYQALGGGPRPAIWSLSPDLPARVTLTRIDKTIGASLDAARVDSDRRVPAFVNR